VRIETSDTSRTTHYAYDKQGRIAIEKTIYKEGDTWELRFFYDNKDKLISLRKVKNDTIVVIEEYVYKNNVLTQSFGVLPTDTLPVVGTGFFEYNPKGQLIHYAIKQTDGFTLSNSYEYAPEGWLKRWTCRTSKDWNTVTDMIWDAHQTIIDEPYRLFFKDFPVMNWRVIDPLSVKGNWKGSIQYKIESDGKLTKVEEDEVFDIKADAQGLWTENKYRNSSNNKVVTCWAVYEGCKN
jgi:hypothetical protein